MPVTPTAMHLIMRQVQDIDLNPTEGIRLLRSDDLGELLFEITGPEGTPFAGGTFHVVLYFDEGYPTVPPRGVFRTKIFHPNIAEKGDICVNVLKRDWQPSLGLRHVLTVIRCLLIEPNAESALNEEAARLLMEDYEAYRRKADMITKVHAVKPARGGATASNTGSENNGPKPTANSSDSHNDNDNYNSYSGNGNENDNNSSTTASGGGLRLSLHTNHVENNSDSGDGQTSSSLSAATATAAAKKAVERKRAALRRI